MIFFSKNKFFLGFVIAVIMCSCNNNKNKLTPYGKVVEGLMITDNGTFRGFNFGNSIDSISKKEFQKAIETDSNYLYYENKIDTTAYYNITYNFDDRILDEIQCELFIRDNTKTDEVYSNLKKYYESHFGSPQNHMGYSVWTTKSADYGQVRINISNESSDFTVDNAPGKISIWIYPDND